MENRLLIKQVQHDNEINDVLIEKGIIIKIAPHIDAQTATIIDGSQKAILPAFYNGHTHSPMTLLRGYADDYDLFTWLTHYIWPAESQMTEEDIYHATKLALLEMIKSGCCFYNDMYYHQDHTVRATEEMKMRACIGLIMLERLDAPAIMEKSLKTNNTLIEEKEKGAYSHRIQLAYAPHAVYTISSSTFQKLATLSHKHQLPIHIHLSETAKEVEDCIKTHGKTPVAYLNDLGVLDEQVIAAHCVHLTDEDIRILKEKNVTIIHNPCSNMKLVSGTFPYKRLRNADCKMILGTDSCGSNNNLSMFDEMKTAALWAKQLHKNPTIASAHEVYKMATQDSAEAFGINGGIIAEGKVADCILVDLNHPALIGYDLIANMVYAADSSCVHTLICDGNILMHNRIVENEDQIIANAKNSLKKFIQLRNNL